MKYIHHTLLSLGLALALASCSEPTPKKLSEQRLEAIDDSLAYIAALEAQKRIKPSITAIAETTPVPSSAGEDAADDPAIWVHPTDPSRSVIYGSNKKGGIVSYDLSGRQGHYYEMGNVNNIDVLTKLTCDRGTVSLLGATNRTTQSMDLFWIDDQGGLSSAYALPAGDEIDDIYGFCFATDSVGQSYALYNAKNGLTRQYALRCVSDTLQLDLVREMRFDGQVEGMVSCQRSGQVYIGEEDRGVWRIALDPSSTTTVLLPLSGEDNPAVRYDIEGLTVLSDDHHDLLIASSQGNFSYAVFDIRADHTYLGSFSIRGSGAIDGAEETDGLEVVTDSLSPTYPHGLVVAQDGFNHDGDSLANQNFKYARAEEILTLLKK